MARIRLQVPAAYQRKGTAHCGAVCSKMVLGYYDSRRPAADLVRDMKVRSFGISMPKLGNWFLGNGFDVTIMADYWFMPPRFIKLRPDKVRGEALKWCARNRNSAILYRRRFAKEMRKFIYSGGEFVPKPVAVRDLQKALKRQEPPILNIDSAVLYNKSTRGRGHYVVVRGINGSQIEINDPGKLRKGHRTCHRDQLMRACCAWSSGAVFISPKGK